MASFSQPGTGSGYGENISWTTVGADPARSVSGSRRKCGAIRRGGEFSPSCVNIDLVTTNGLQDLDLENEVPLREAPWQEVYGKIQAEKVRLNAVLYSTNAHE